MLPKLEVLTSHHTVAASHNTGNCRGHDRHGKNTHLLPGCSCRLRPPARNSSCAGVTSATHFLHAMSLDTAQSVSDPRGIHQLDAQKLFSYLQSALPDLAKRSGINIMLVMLFKRALHDTHANKPYSTRHRVAACLVASSFVQAVQEAQDTPQALHIASCFAPLRLHTPSPARAALHPAVHSPHVVAAVRHVS